MKDIHLIRLRVNGREHELAVEASSCGWPLTRSRIRWMSFTGGHLR